MIEHLTLETFKEKIMNFDTYKDEWKFEGKLPAIIDFWAEWCGPCKMLSPILEDLAVEYEGKINIYKIDTEEEQELSIMFNIKSIPSMLFIPMDGQPEMTVGAFPKEKLKKAIEEVLLKN